MIYCVVIKIASALIVFEEKLLLHLRDDKHPDPNLRSKWGLIGGIIEKGENPETAVRREIKEESNLEPKMIRYLGKLYIDKSENEKIESNLFCSVLTKDEAKKLKLGNEGLAVKFLSTDEVKKVKLSPEVEKYYKKYHKQVDRFIKTGNPPESGDIT